MKCLIVDDEPLAQDVIESYIEKTPGLDLVGKCKNAFEAGAALKENQVDLMFLDIQMPDITGTEFIAGLKKKPMVIFTTAYSEYAVDGFELDAIDYLLKPISPDRFLKAVNKAQELFNLKKGGTAIPRQEEEKDFMFVKSEYQSVKINFADILYIEGLKDYVKIFTTKGMVLTLITLKGITEKLPIKQFMRVHRSYIVSLGAIEKIERHRIIIGDKRIPVGDGYKDEFYKRIE